jgi:hypothetical protein
MALDHSCQVQRHPLSERGLDFYSTPPCAIEAYLKAKAAGKVAELPRHLLDPFSGCGGIANPLRAQGYHVTRSDIVDRDGQLDFVADFYSLTKLPPGVQGIIGNPPYRECAKAAPLVRHALDLSPVVILLMQLAFYESEARTEILEQRGLKSVHVFRLRLPMMHRGGWEGREANSGMAFCWMRWDRGYTGPTFIDRISWEK